MPTHSSTMNPIKLLCKICLNLVSFTVQQRGGYSQTLKHKY